MKDKEIQQPGHVFYFEPNDTSMGTDQDGMPVPLVPHLEDMCISMSLTADIYGRNKTSIDDISKEGNTTKIQRKLSWVSYVNQDYGSSVDSNVQLTAAGTQLGDERYLTTYYTEISADKYIENELVEGLGITGINISFESWYTPTITINFVDVHGSALWGREEAIYDNGELTAGNILGVFFTQPYPLFRLQIKGFLGDAVTYQLSVSSFKGRYNSQTGNFEATATFIGYSYSLLTDIPLKMLSVIPEVDYVAKKYWESRINSTDWQMHNADGTESQPIPLFLLIENIRSAVGSLESLRAKNCDGTEIDLSVANSDGAVQNAVEKDQSVSLSAANLVTCAADANNELNVVIHALDDFIKACRDFCEKERGGKMFIGESEESSTSRSKNVQLLMLFGDCGGNGDNLAILSKDTLRVKYNAFDKAVETYNAAHPNEKISNYIKGQNPYNFHKDATTCDKNKLYVTATKIFNISTEKNKDVSHINGKCGKIENIKVTNRNLYKDTASQLEKWRGLFDDFVSTYPSKGVGFGEYAFLMPLGGMVSDLNARARKINEAANNVNTTAEDNAAGRSNSSQRVTENGFDDSKDREEERNDKILKLIGFEPTIGNFVKLTMCHLETFVEVMFKCAENIFAEMREDKRLPSALGVTGLNYTDIPTGASANSVEKNETPKQVYPWPALYNPTYDSSNNETPSNDIGGKDDVLGWPLDYQAQEGNSWEEGKVILSFLDTISRCSERINGKYKNTVSNTYTSIPMTGMDLSTLSSPFYSVAATCRDIDCLAGYLGLRMAQTIGLADNKCESEIAEAIGSIDAINLIMSSMKPELLKDVIKSKDGNQDFASRVIDYITCNNKTKSSVETERGDAYNIFESSSNGTYYHNNRHPMYVSDGNGTYRYAYTFANSTSDKNKMVSLIPTEIRPFTASNNPYAKYMEPQVENGKVQSYKPIINKKEDQCFVYGCKTKELDDLKEVDGSYMNDQLFYVVTDPNQVFSLTKQAEWLKEGSLNIKDYSIKGADSDNNVKKFIERRYQLGMNDYSRFYFGNKDYHIVGPSISTLDEDYSSKHLCLTNDNRESAKFDTQWCYDKNSALYKKLTMKKDGDDFAFKNADNSFALEELRVLDLPIMTNSKVIGSLFGSKIYYNQNEINDPKQRNLAKAYLILSSLMAGVDKPEEDLFKSDKWSIIKLMPPFYVLFIGALLWREKMLREETPQDLRFDGYAKPDIGQTIISKSEKIMYVDTQQKMDWYTLEDYYMKYEDIDDAVKNKLIYMFEWYGQRDLFTRIINNCELVTQENNVIKMKEWDDLKSKWSDSTFDPSSPSKWASLFGNTFHKYSSMCLPENKQVLRLLINEDNEAMNSLLWLYGISTSFAVGRATTKRVGLGETEVRLNKSQMSAYLRGFEKRIKELQSSIKEEEKKTESKPSQVINRDIAVSMYYSLKHLWDSWLITAGRDQFTIQQFFNKYFIFIDSFYMNTYSKIKLNAEKILDSYNREEQNLLSFIDNVTSSAGCMLFALPDFIDSNVYDDSSVAGYNGNNKSDYSWKRDTLARIFTPIPYNEMRKQQTSNVFVFIYTHPYSDTAHENTDKRFDSYMMNDTSTWPSALKQPVIGNIGVNGDRMTDDNDASFVAHPNNSLPNGAEELITGRHGYMMPCFGVAVNRGNNVIFKSINVNMDSPKITAVAAQTMENVYTKAGADGSKRIFFHGQDIYSIYSQYCYECEIEMMGCAQIQPLMYFQLLNIPMWRGTYMIYKVTHSMTPGNMVTKFTGMKMSRKQAPFATGYFTIGKQATNSNINFNGTEINIRSTSA